MSPSEYRGVARFRRAVGAARAGRSLAEAALLSGYADQPHFNRECQALMGMAPRAILAGMDGVDASEERSVGGRGDLDGAA